VQIAAIRDYVALLWGEYQGAKRQRRGAILDELGRNLRIHCKSATRLMNSEQAPLLGRGKGSGGRKLYSQPARAALKIAWKDMGYLGAARLKAPCFRKDVGSFKTKGARVTKDECSQALLTGIQRRYHH